jgi:hypothetical protein
LIWFADEAVGEKWIVDEGVVGQRRMDQGPTAA